MREGKMLSDSLLGSDVEAMRQRRARRRRALVAAVVFEAVLLGGLLLWPMLTPGGLPPNLVIMPRVFHGLAVDKTPSSPMHPAAARRTASFTNPIFAPVRIPLHIATPNVTPPSVSLPPTVGPGSQGPGTNVPGIPNGLVESNLVIAPPHPRPVRLIRKSEGVQSGMLIHRVDPAYPAFARSAHVSGDVELSAIIGRDGNVSSVQVLSGNPVLVPATLDAVRQWRYRPTLLDGEAVEVETRITVSFVLDE